MTQILTKFLIILVLAVPSHYLNTGVGQLFRFIKDSQWNDHYRCNTSKFKVTNRFRVLDLLTDLVLGFLLFCEILTRAKLSEPFIGDYVLAIGVPLLVLEKWLRANIKRVA